jgi:hypothetical protein
VAEFRIVVTGRYHEPVDDDRAAAISDSLRRLWQGASSEADPRSGSFHYVLLVPGRTANEAESLARTAAASALFDGGFSRLTATIDDVSTRPLH